MLYNDKIVVEYKDFSQVVIYEIKIDQIGFDLQYEKGNNLMIKIYLSFWGLIPLIYLSICFFKDLKIELIPLLCSIALALFFIIINYFNRPKDVIFLIGNQKNLVFYRTIPNEKLVLEFIEEVISRSKKHLKLTYTAIQNHMTYEEYNGNLNWLLNRDIISRIKFDNLIEEFKIKQLL